MKRTHRVGLLSQLIDNLNEYKIFCYHTDFLPILPIWGEWTHHTHLWQFLLAYIIPQKKRKWLEFMKMFWYHFFGRLNTHTEFSMDVKLWCLLSKEISSAVLGTGWTRLQIDAQPVSFLMERSIFFLEVFLGRCFYNFFYIINFSHVNYHGRR